MQGLYLVIGLTVWLSVGWTIALIIKDSRRYEPNEEDL